MADKTEWEARATKLRKHYEVEMKIWEARCKGMVTDSEELVRSSQNASSSSLPTIHAANTPVTIPSPLDYLCSAALPLASQSALRNAPLSHVLPNRVEKANGSYIQESSLVKALSSNVLSSAPTFRWND